MALVRAGDTLRNDLISRFPAAIFYLEEGAFIPYLKKVMLTKDIPLYEGKRENDPLHFGDITYQTTQIQIVDATYREATTDPFYGDPKPERYEGLTRSVSKTMLAGLQKGLGNKEDIPRALSIIKDDRHIIYFILVGLLNGDL